MDHTRFLAAALPGDRTARSRTSRNPGGGPGVPWSRDLVAGDGFEPPTFGL